MDRGIARTTGAVLLGVVIASWGVSLSVAAQGTVREARAVSDIQRVVILGVGDLFIRQAQSESLIIEAEPKVLPKISTTVKGGTLFLDTSGNVSTQWPLRYELTVRHLQEVRSEGSGQVMLRAIHVPALNLTLAGSSELQAEDLKANSLNLSITGSGSVTAAGEVSEQSILISGAGEFNGEHLRGRSATVHIAGSGSAAVQVRDALHVTIDGSGSVTYQGNPRVDQVISGAGEVSRR